MPICSQGGRTFQSATLIFKDLQKSDAELQQIYTKTLLVQSKGRINKYRGKTLVRGSSEFWTNQRSQEKTNLSNEDEKKIIKSKKQN
jgi:hypothetical protein